MWKFSDGIKMKSVIDSASKLAIRNEPTFLAGKYNCGCAKRKIKNLPVFLSKTSKWKLPDLLKSQCIKFKKSILLFYITKPTIHDWIKKWQIEKSENKIEGVFSG